MRLPRPAGVRARAHVGRAPSPSATAALAAALREAPQPAGAGGEHDVVGADAEAPADRAQVGERARDADVVAARRARAVERRARRGREEGVRERAGAAAREPGQPPRSARQAHRGERERRAVGGAVDDGAREPLAGRRGTAPATTRRRRDRVPPSARRRAARSPSSTTAVPSTMQWCALPTIAMRPPGSESAIHISHSGRSRRSGVERMESTSALRSSPSARQEMVGGVEGGVVDPHRVVEPERHARQALAVARRALQPPGDVRGRAPRRSGRGPSSGGSKAATQPTCIGADGVSTARKEASRADSRSAVTAGRRASLRPAAASGRR